MGRFDDKLLSEVDRRVAVSRELLAKSGLSQEIITSLGNVFLLIVALKNQIFLERADRATLAKRVKMLEGHLLGLISCSPDDFPHLATFARATLAEKDGV